MSLAEIVAAVTTDQGLRNIIDRLTEYWLKELLCDLVPVTAEQHYQLARNLALGAISPGYDKSVIINCDFQRRWAEREPHALAFQQEAASSQGKEAK